MLIDTLSAPLSVAADTNLLNVDPVIFDVRITEPTGDGIHRAGYDGAIASPTLLVIPFCEGAPGSEFTMRIWGWWQLGAIGDVNNVQWFPLLLAELLCVAGSRQGNPLRAVSETEYLCESLTLTDGNLGANGFVVSPGAGSGRTAYLKLHLHGCQKFQFDFQVGEEPPSLANALYTKTSAY